MDGLSVEASVAGLLQISDKIIEDLSDVADAPPVVHELLAEVRDMRTAFGQLETFLRTCDDRQKDRTSMVDIDDLVAILTGCVCTFSELDAVLELSDQRGRIGPRSRARGAVTDLGLDRISRNLNSEKSPLAVLLSMVTADGGSPAGVQARGEKDELKSLVADLLSDPDLAQRMASFASTAVTSDAASALTKTPGRGAPIAPAIATGGNASIFTTSSHRSSGPLRRAFERTLVQTRVYKNATRNVSIDSFHTDDTTDSRWSQLSGLSLAQISNISVICLPVYTVELHNGHMYSQISDASCAPKSVAVLPSKMQALCAKIVTNMPQCLQSEAARIRRLHTSAKTGDSDLDAQDDHGKTALHRAAGNGRNDTVRKLLNLGAYIDAIDADGMSPLHHAVGSGSTKTVQLLLESEANTEFKDKQGLSPLHFAVRLWQNTATPEQEIIRLLLKHGADIKTTNRNGETPLDTATLCGGESVFQLLVDEREIAQVAEDATARVGVRREQGTCAAPPETDPLRKCGSGGMYSKHLSLAPRRSERLMHEEVRGQKN